MGGFPAEVRGDHGPSDDVHDRGGTKPIRIHFDINNFIRVY
jgi:hypothetical protein